MAIGCRFCPAAFAQLPLTFGSKLSVASMSEEAMTLEQWFSEHNRDCVDLMNGWLGLHSVGARVYFSDISAHADGERRGLDGIGGQRRKGLGATRLQLPLGRHWSSAFAVGMLREQWVQEHNRECVDLMNGWLGLHSVGTVFFFNISEHADGERRGPLSI